LDKSEQEKPAQTEPITPEKEQELLAQLNGEFVKSDADQLDAKLRELPLKSEAKEAAQPKEKQGEIEQKEDEQADAKLGESDQTESKKGQVWIVQTNPKSAERFSPFYWELISTAGVIWHTPDPKKAQKFESYSNAQDYIDLAIVQSSGRYIADNFKIVKKP
jgi:hypothetical protein